MYNKKRIVLCRCVINLAAGMLASFLIVSAFADMIRVVGDTKTFTVGTTQYSNLAETTYLDNIEMSGHLEIRNLSGSSPAGHLGARPIVYRQQSIGGEYKLAQYGELELSRNTTSVFSGSTSVMSLIKGYYYVTSGETVVYYNGRYVTEQVIMSPAIRAD